MKAMIFAAGFGKRLQPLTLDTPKALVKVQGRPMLDWVVQRLVRHGVTDLIINTHHLHHLINNYIQERGFPIPVRLSHETDILGTGGGLNRTRNFWDSNPFFVHNVDILCNADLNLLSDHHRAENAAATLAINEKQSDSMLLVDERGFLVGKSFKDNWQLAGKAEGRIREVGFCGFQVISPEFWNLVPPPMSFSIIDDYLFLIKAGGTVATWSIGTSYWEDIGTPEALSRAEAEFCG